jgi:hypothetical protein
MCCLRRLFVVALSFSDDILEAVKSGRYAPISEGKKIERETNKLVNFCQRALNKGNFEISEMLRHHMLTERLEVIGDALGDYAAYVSLAKPKIGERLIGFHRGINDYFRLIFKEYFKPKKDLAVARELRFRLYSEFEALLKEKRIDTAGVCYLKQVLEELHHIEIIV